MELLVVDASEVTTLVDPKGVKTERAKQQEKGHLFNHADASKNLDTPRERQPCPICGETNHRVRNCEKFRRMTVEDRLNAVERWKLCQVCLYDHGQWKCRSKLLCNVDQCRAPHHSLLHKAPAVRSAVVQAHEQNKNSVLFRVVPIQLCNGKRRVNTYAFLDEGSSLSLIEDKLVRDLAIGGVTEPLEMKWTSNIVRKEKNSKRLDVQISGCNQDNWHWLKSVHTIDELNLPEQTLEVSEITSF